MSGGCKCIQPIKQAAKYGWQTANCSGTFVKCPFNLLYRKLGQNASFSGFFTPNLWWVLGPKLLFRGGWRLNWGLFFNGCKMLLQMCKIVL